MIEDRRVYSMKKLAEIIPQLENKRHEKVDVDTLAYTLSIVDVWAKANGLKLFQMFAVYGAGTYFIFDYRYPRWHLLKRWWRNNIVGVV